MEIKKIPQQVAEKEVFSLFPEYCCFMKLSSSLGAFFKQEPKEKELLFLYVLRKVFKEFNSFAFFLLKKGEKGEFLTVISYNGKEEKVLKYPFLREAISVLLKELKKENVKILLCIQEEVCKSLTSLVAEEFLDLEVKKVKVQKEVPKKELESYLIRKKSFFDQLKKLFKSRKGRGNGTKNRVFLFLLFLVGAFLFYKFYEGKRKVAKVKVNRIVNYKKLNRKVVETLVSLQKEGKVLVASGFPSGIRYYSFSPCFKGKEVLKIGSLRECFFLLPSKTEKETKRERIRGEYLIKERGNFVFKVEKEGKKVLEVPSYPVKATLSGDFLYLSKER